MSVPYNRDARRACDSSTMTSESKHLSERINRPADEVYDYASDPANLPEWAPGLGSSVEQVDGRWFVDTPMGRVGFAFAPRNNMVSSITTSRCPRVRSSITPYG